MNYLVTSDPMNVHHIKSKSFDNYVKGSEFREIFQVFGLGIFTTDSETWRYHRSLLLSLFKNRKFEMFLEKTTKKKVECSLIPTLEDVRQHEIEVDLQDVFNRFTFDNICSIVLGYDPNCLSIEFPQVACEKAFNEAEESIFYRHVVPKSVWKLLECLQIGQEKKMSEACKVFDQFIYSCTASKREELRKYNKSQRDEAQVDLLSVLMMMREEEEEKGQGQSQSQSQTLLVNDDKYEEIWGKDCLEFKPERWISEKGGIIHVPSYKFISFNAGPRTCLGKDLSFMQIKMVAASILCNYHIHVVEGHQAIPNHSIVLLMKDGLKVRITKREGF
ncbi:hypothetical protein AHAS_Ahas15G0364200 [Arachis hypogaea]